MIREYLKELKLPHILQQYERFAKEMQRVHGSYEDYLCALLEQEVENRRENSVKKRLQQAQFPLLKTLDQFDFSALPGLSVQEVMQLSRGGYIEEKRNIFLIGGSGTGKTHMATALAVCACQQGKRVRFTTVSALLGELMAARENHQLHKLEKQWLKYELVVCDELGYLKCSREEAEILFDFFSARYERGSMILTTNLEFSEWNQVFENPKLTVAMLDRLTHRAHILLMDGDSYRLKQTLRKPTKEKGENGNSAPPLGVAEEIVSSSNE